MFIRLQKGDSVGQLARIPLTRQNSTFLRRLNAACENIFRLAWRLGKLFCFFLICFWFAFQPYTLTYLFEFKPLKYEPERYKNSTVSGCTAKDVIFSTGTGIKLHGWYFPVANSKKTMLVHHGQGGNITYYCNIIAPIISAGYSVFLYDYEGFGLSEGMPSNPALIRDGEAAYDFAIKNLKLSPRQIIHCGVSLGTGVACEVARTRPACAVVLFSPYTSLWKLAREIWPLIDTYPEFMFPPDLRTSDFISRNRSIPVYFLAGAKDPLIKVHHADELFAMAHCPKAYLRFADRAHCDFPVADCQRFAREALNKLN